jgi:simple sugar transport system ATP-binding protein
MGWLSAGSAAKHAERLLSTFDVVHGALEAPVSTLSGGNQQKLMLGREVLHEPEVLLASQPTRGVDIGGIQTIHQMLRAERDRGAAVLLESEDLDELLLLSDEVIVFYGGSIAGRFQRPFDRQAIGNAMVGAHAHVA